MKDTESCSSTACSVSLCLWLLDHQSSWVYVHFNKKEPERGRKVFQHMGSIAMLVTCSDSQVQSLFIQLALLANPKPSVQHARIVIELL